jgi:carbonic anhydrase
MHIVNANSDKSQLSVIGILFDVEHGGNQSNWFIEDVLQNATNLNSPNKFNVSTLDVKKYVDSIEKKNMYHYDGSLTTPGCAEIVEWIVLDSLQNISPQQLATFTKKWADDYSYARGYGNARVT